MPSTFPRSTTTRLAFAFVALALPFTLGDAGDGRAASSRSPAPDVRGEWGITYDDRIGVEIDIGGAHYEAEIPARGGTVEIIHDGPTLAFDSSRARATGRPGPGGPRARAGAARLAGPARRASSAAR